MAKINPIFGKFQGKLGGNVFAIRNGEQIIREYNPSPQNPSTSAQVAARAKLKLLSQLSAVYAPVIAMPRRGAVSSRNLFVKKNIVLASYAENEASINLPSVQLTNSVVGIPQLVVSTTDTTTIDVSLGSLNVDVNRVIYVAFRKRTDKTMSLYSSIVVSEKGTSTAPFGGTMPYTNNELVIYAYGVRDNTDAARAMFGNIEATTGEQVASLITERRLTEADITLTETVGVQFKVSE